MTINLQTLKCGECGSGVLRRSGLNQYTCAHCGSMSIVEDDVSDRLERVLEQVKDEAGRRLAAEHSARQRHVVKSMAIAASAIVVLVTVVFAVTALLVGGKEPAGTGTVAAASTAPRAIPVDGLKFDPPRQVLVGSGSPARPRLLVVARNETGVALERPSVKAIFYDGDSRIGEGSESLPIGTLAPGETAPVLIDLPSDRNVTRQEVQVAALSAPYRSVEGPRLQFTRVRLVQQQDELRLVGRIVNARKDTAMLTGVEVLATLYDDAGAIIGFGRGFSQANEIKPGERSAADVRIERLGNRQVPIAAWDYRIDYNLSEHEQQGRTRVLSAGRVIRTAGGPEIFHPSMRLGSEDLLADEAERFDLAQIELLALVPARNVTQRPVYLAEVVNRSSEAIALAPSAVISRYDGSKLDGTTAVAGPAYLYPGERFPVLLEPRETDRISSTRVEWKPMRRAALPGPRAPLQVRIDDTRAATSSVLVNFSRRYSYKYVEVSGTVANPGQAIVRKPRLWVSLRDADGKLAGFTLLDNLPAIAPGESVPFQAKVDQFGRDFASVDTLYQSD
ncbi:TFIIB-type zinc ribbon-containing protein [Variovorax paradoxus]|nr:TFIIB-type zinc ribbon-containing protein [Variovorax paradoxus]